MAYFVIINACKRNSNSRLYRFDIFYILKYNGTLHLNTQKCNIFFFGSIIYDDTVLNGNPIYGRYK